MMQSTTLWFDRLIGRLLFVDVQSKITAENDLLAQRAERTFGASVMFSGIRCVLQYAVLPFVLPLIGIAAETALPVMLAINVLAIISIFFSLRRFWQIGYKYRWQYLIVALAALAVLTAFIALDLSALLSSPT
jgi:hypothetical protein